MRAVVEAGTCDRSRCGRRRSQPGHSEGGGMLPAYLRHAALDGNDVVGLAWWFSLAKARFAFGWFLCSLREPMHGLICVI